MNASNRARQVFVRRRRGARLVRVLLGCVLLGWVLLVGISCSSTPVFELDHGAVIRADAGRRQLALVFTGGEFGEGTADILDTLDRSAIRASFFLTGAFLADPTRRRLVARMVDEGHYVGPHSHAHLLYCPWDDRATTLVDRATFRADLRRNVADLRALGALPPGQPVHFIPPYEWFNETHVRWAASLGISVFNFTPGTGSNRDYIPEGQKGFARSAAILDGILEFEASDPRGLNGFFLLLHLGSERADKMHLQFPRLVDELSRRGYAFRRVDEILEIRTRSGR